ncbi:glycosyltransferase family 2 protein [Bacillus thuringiensis]|uniref:glycosyltransferase family 2 protein n=1 Tax=Bacillus thuringiensis TaxID=1428 RepID=UPI000BFD14DE|nr:glycosyltransferase family 2 protein [Bacillus thuringiensis]PGW35223.1 glycosyltransferase [Bacillus thuringiensis]
MEYPTITLCMIVKNEELVIEKCLERVKEIVDEIIIVDTGSTDNTINICEKYTKNIYHFNWNHHFAKARNFSIQFAKSDWILWLDADEEIDAGQFKDIKTILKQTNAEILYLPIINYVGDKINDEEIYQISQPRLFRNDLGLTFKYIIHEQLDISKRKFESINVNIPINHYGYLDGRVKEKNKHQRNLELLQLGLQEKNPSPFIEYYLASEYFSVKNNEKAFYFVNECIRKFIEQGLLPNAIVYQLKYTIILASKYIHRGWPSINYAIKLHPDCVYLHFLKASILYHLKKYHDAIDTLDYCIELGENNPNHLILKGTGSFRAIDLKKKCLKKLKNYN